MSNDSLTPLQRAEKKRSEKRKGTPTFSAVRFKSAEDKDMVDDVFRRHGGTREQALIDAAKSLHKELKKRK